MFFSVIVPVYKVERYLPACVDSILAQPCGDFELILVDDGSPDAAPGLCDAYAARDSRVRVIHQPNQGVVRARQAGLLAAKGEYILFVDGDDWIAPQCLVRGRELIEETGAELVMFAASREYGERSEAVCSPVPEGLYDKTAMRERVFPLLLVDGQMRHMSNSPCDKLLRRDLAERGFLTVPSVITLGEDLLSVLPAYLRVERAYISREVMSYFRIRRQSASHGFHIGDYRQIELVLEELEQLSAQESNLPEDFDRQIERYGAFMCFVTMVHAADDGCRRYLGEIRRQMRRPRLRACMRRARFGAITVKSRITLMLLRANLISPAYWFLRLCRWIKSWGREMEMLWKNR